jgi:hypothetical protein
MRLLLATLLPLTSTQVPAHASVPEPTSPPTSLSALSTMLSSYEACPERDSAQYLPGPPVPTYQGGPDVILVRPQDFGLPAADPDAGFMFGGGGALALGLSDTGDSTYAAAARDPRHLFRMDPDRQEVQGTTRHDFFLEDLLAAKSDAPASQGDLDAAPAYDSAPVRVTVPAAGNDKIYLIDGNLWLDHSATFSFVVGSDSVSGAEPDGTRITFVVRGNIYISDNVLYENVANDAVAFVALKRTEDYPDEASEGERVALFANEASEGSASSAAESSGNIQFGDPTFGTTFRFAGYLFAENDFVADNVAHTLHVYGNMTAGASCATRKGGLVVDYDARLELGLVTLPGLPVR